MDEEAQWPNQYDSIFSAFPIHVPLNLLEQLPLSSNNRLEWPKATKLPQLARILELLENFLSDGRNWMKKGCSQGEMTAIEQKLNELMICLQCQKHYGWLFWQKQNRRVQASVVHSYIFLKMFAVALVPHNYSSLLHANSEEKLMTEVFKLENLINDWIQLMKPIQAFMLSAEFSSERDLTDAFFNQLYQFFKGLPKIQKTSMGKVPKLMEFVNVCLQIQLQEQEIRSRSTSRSSPSQRRESNLRERENHFINSKILGEQKKKEGLEFFRFDERVRVHTSYHKKKKLTVTSIETKEKSESNDKSRSPSLDRSLSILESDRLKRGTLNESPNRDSSNPKVRSRLLTSKTNNSDKSRQRSRKRSMEIENGQRERDGKLKKTKAAALPIKVVQLSQQLNLEKGVCRGWGIIREYVKKRIAERKLRKLFLL